MRFRSFVCAGTQWLCTQQPGAQAHAQLGGAGGFRVQRTVGEVQDFCVCLEAAGLHLMPGTQARAQLSSAGGFRVAQEFGWLIPLLPATADSMLLVRLACIPRALQTLHDCI